MNALTPYRKQVREARERTDRVVGRATRYEAKHAAKTDRMDRAVARVSASADALLLAVGRIGKAMVP